jgi:hypothetical protein
MRHHASSILIISGALFLFALGWWGAGQLPVRLTMEPRSDRGDTYTPRYQHRSGEQLVMVYLGAAGCGWSRLPQVREAVRHLKAHLAATAHDQGLDFRAVGVALDWSPRDGIRHLARFGSFDEVSAGYQFGNAHAIRYIWSNGGAQPATPQVLIYRIRFTAPSATNSVGRFAESDRFLVAALVGVETLTRWHVALPWELGPAPGVAAPARRRPP